MDLQLNDFRVLVTGGTRGIGRAVVEAFVDEGAVVEFCARDAGEIEETEKAIAERGGRATGVQVDVGDGPALSSWVEAAAGRMGGVDGVVANVSALAVPDTEENWQRSFEIDLMHTVRLAKAALPYLEAGGRGSIVALSSVTGREADFASGPYGTMKTAIVGYISGLAFQLAGRGVRANVVSPGNTFFEGGIWNGIQQGDPDLYADSLALNPTGRMGKPEEMARAVVFLTSPVSSFTTGTNLVVDGALTRGIQL
ncbi:MAG: short-chain dehydrogenase/reductase [Blastococcus sp.]|jgi:3-oxoacyl-[acyl-carrier protein] reductase|nr:short-chain dehydrogenase/reductase [Blastococcus sp.]